MTRIKSTYTILAISALVITAVLLFVMSQARNTSESGNERVYKVGVVSYGGAHLEVVKGLIDGMASLQYHAGDNIEYIEVDAEGDEDKVREATEMFVSRNVDAIYTVSTPITKLAMEVAHDVPLVFNLVSDPVGVGIAESIQSSGNNSTGCSNAVGQTGPKRLEILKIMFPDLKRVLVLYDPSNSFSQDAIIILRDAASKLNVELVEKEVDSSDSVIEVLSTISEGDVDAFFHLGEAKVSGVADEVIALANSIKLPTLAHAASFTKRGMLASFGPSWLDLGEQCAITLDKVLRGVNPSEVPVQLPARFELVINLNTAEELGIELNQEVRARADRFIK